jgi:hypothetical protein
MNRKIMLIPFGVIALVLLNAAVAYACTAWVGTFQVWGNKDSYSSSVVSWGTSPAGAFNMTQVIQGTAYASCLNSAQKAGYSCATNAQGKIKVKTGYNSYENNKLPGDSATSGYNYDINFYDDKTYDSSRNWLIDCMSPASGSIVFKRLGQVHVNTSGVIDRTSVGTVTSSGVAGPFNLPTTAWSKAANGGESAVCVSDAGAYYGNQIPLTVL